ncbi:beta-ketoacyl-ACP synthase III [Streptomyces violaceorubidus]
MSEVTDWTGTPTVCSAWPAGAGAAVVDGLRAGRGGGDRIRCSWGSVPEIGNAVRIEGTPPRFAQEGQSVPLGDRPAAAIARQACERSGPARPPPAVPPGRRCALIEPLAAKIGAVNAVVARDVVESGFTSAASIPLALSKLVERGEITTGDPVLLFGFGGNLSYAGQVVRCP